MVAKSKGKHKEDENILEAGLDNKKKNGRAWLKGQATSKAELKLAGKNSMASRVRLTGLAVSGSKAEGTRGAKQRPEEHSRQI